MKLQKTNKYKNKIAKGISTILLTSMLLTGCNVANATSQEEHTQTEVVTIANDIEEKNDEIEENFGDFNVKYPYLNWSMADIFVAIIKDSSNNIKVLETFGVVNDDYFELYDLFTERELFKIPYVANGNYFQINDNCRCINAKISDAIKIADYLQDKEIICLGRASYELLFRSDLGIKVSKDIEENNFYNVYGETVYFSSDFMTTKTILENYMIYVPDQYRVTSKDMNLEVENTINTKYSDCWKLSEEEIDERIESLNISTEEPFLVGQVNTLVLKDAADNYKLLNVFFCEIDDYLVFFDVYTGNELFSIKKGKTPIFNEKEDVFENIDFSNLDSSIEYFNDKKILYMSSSFETKQFLHAHIPEFRERDGIDYVQITETICNLAYPYYLDDMSKYSVTANDLASLYVRLPKGMYVTAKELGFEKEKVKSLD